MLGKWENVRENDLQKNTEEDKEKTQTGHYDIIVGRLQCSIQLFWTLIVKTSVRRKQRFSNYQTKK